MKSKPKDARFRSLTEPGLDETERMARENAAETYRGALLALVDEVRRLRGKRSESRREEACGA